MAIDPHDIADVMKAAITNLHFPLSAVAYNAGVSRKRLREFLDGTAALRSSEIKAVMDLLELETALVESEPRRIRNFAVNTIQFHGISEGIMLRSLCYIGNGHATGTLVSIGMREFVATAAHTIPSDHSTTLLIGQGTTDVNQTGRFIVVTGKVASENPDVGYIEIEPGTAKRLGREAIDVDRLCDAGPGQPGRIAFLYGFPFVLVQKIINHKRREMFKGVRSITYSNSTLAVDEWPAVPWDAVTPKRSVDVFLPYDTTEEMYVNNSAKNTLPHPGGVSGGGIWQGTAPKDNPGIWNPDTVKLIAIQGGWHKKGKYVRGVQIKHWVRLIHRDYPDLRNELCKVSRV